MPAIPTTWEEEIGRIIVLGQSRQKVPATTSQSIKDGCGVMHLSF
jgi:hypothetical protein